MRYSPVSAPPAAAAITAAAGQFGDALRFALHPGAYVDRVPLGGIGRLTRLFEPVEFAGEHLAGFGQTLLQRGNLAVDRRALLAGLREPLLGGLPASTATARGLLPCLDLLLNHRDLLLVSGILLARAAAQIGGVLLCLGMQRRVLLVGKGALAVLFGLGGCPLLGHIAVDLGPQIGDFALDVVFQGAQLFVRLRASGLDLLLQLRPRQLRTIASALARDCSICCASACGPIRRRRAASRLAHAPR